MKRFMTGRPVTLADSLELVRYLQPHCMDAGWYLALAGGVLNTGQSENDMDLVAVPREQDSKIQTIIPFLIEQISPISNISLKPGGLHIKFYEPIEILFVYPRSTP